MNPTTALNSAIQELNHTIATLARCPATDQPATAALHSATTAQAYLRDALAAATPADISALAAPTGEPGAFNLISELWERAAPSLDHEPRNRICLTAETQRRRETNELQQFSASPNG
ncbi:MAG: hypothetical protein WC091_26340 [Sulfuricellaceae bacterium]